MVSYSKTVGYGLHLPHVVTEDKVVLDLCCENVQRQMKHEFSEADVEAST